MSGPCAEQSNAEDRDNTNDESRVGVYVCHCGGNISDVVDVERVVQTASGLPQVVVARHNPAMCSQAGQDLISDDVEKHGLDRVVVAACTPSLHEHTFRGAITRAGQNPYLYEHVNVREQVSWCSKSDMEGATDKATRLVAAGVAKARQLEALETISVDAKRHVTVVGAGISGLRTARDLSRAEFDVVLIEKGSDLGGRVLHWHRVFPTEENAAELVEPLLEAVRNDPRISVYTQAEIVEASGCVGNFHLEVERNCEEKGADPDAANSRSSRRRFAVSTGAIILATGFDLYEPKTGEFGYKQYPEVITLAELERLLAECETSGESLTWRGRKISNVGLIHCVGSRQVEGVHEPGPNGQLNAYCSRTCCTATLRAAVEMRRRYPEMNVFEFYQDIRTYGRQHEDYYRNATQLGVTFFRYNGDQPPQVSETDASLSVKVRDVLTFGEELDVPVDLVVLATGMVPRNLDTLIDQLKLSRSDDGFLQEVHPKLRPVELAVGGIFVAGTCQAPMDISESCASGSAAAAKATGLLSKGKIELDPFRARVTPDLCKGEGKCVEVCEHQEAITLAWIGEGEHKQQKAVVNTALCNGCGICVAVCPHGAIQIAGWHIQQFDAMVDALVTEYA